MPVRIHDDDKGEWLGPNVEGTVYMSLASANFEYKGDEGKTKANRKEGFFTVGDWGLMDDDGYLFVMGRTDDVINVAGHRLSTGSMEEVLASHPDVAECAVVGAADALKGQVPLGLVVLKAGAGRDPAEVARELVALVRDRIGPVAAFRDARVVPRLPKTRSGKILRASIRRLADGEQVAAPATIDDPAILDEIRAALGRTETS